MAFLFTLPLRVAQGVLTLIILGLSAYDVNRWSGRYTSWSPAEVNYMLFCSIWTILALAYLVVSPLRFPSAAHKFAVLGVETLTMIFWFAAWIALAVLLGDLGCRRWGPCKAGTAATVFAAFQWILFVATTIMAALHVYRTRNDHSSKHDPDMEVRPSGGVSAGV